MSWCELCDQPSTILSARLELMPDAILAGEVPR